VTGAASTRIFVLLAEYKAKSVFVDGSLSLSPFSVYTHTFACLRAT